MKRHSASASVTILRDCLLALGRACGGPVEQGGLLLGTCSAAGTLLYDARPLPGAIRSPRAFRPARWRPPPDLRRDVVGWFHSHPGGEVHLSRADAKVHRHLFPRENGLALVVGGVVRCEPPEEASNPFIFPAAAGSEEPPCLNLALYGGSPLRAMEALRVL